MTRLLIVDDNERNLYMLQVLLEGHGYQVVSARDGAEALEKARHSPPDMIITDILMPVMDGFTLCREWKRDDRLKEIPFIFYTATYTDPKDEEFALSLGAERFIVKPVEPDVFVEMLREIIREAEEGLLVAPREPVEEEAICLKEYNERLVKKLEHKMLQLEEANQALKREITERVRAEVGLRESEEHLRSLVTGASDVITMTDLDGNILFINEAGKTLHGVDDVNELVGRNAFSVIAEESLESAREGMEIVLREGVAKSREYLLVRDDGKKVPVEMNVSLMRDAEGKPFRFMAITRDITERKQAEEAREHLTAHVREQARQMEQVLATVPAGILLLDAEGRVLQANPVAEGDLVALARAKVGDVLTHLGDRPLAELLTSPPTKGLWHEVKADNRTFEVVARPMESGPEPEHWVLVVNDVTREREIQTQLQQQERLAAVGQLAAGIAHDFNNIMAVIVLYARMGLDTPDIPPKLRERLQTVSRQAKRATDLIQQILDFSRRAVLERRPMDLTPFLKEVVKMMERTVPESIKLDFSYGREEYVVNADPTRMQQALLNLVVNARDAMLPQGGGELRIALSRTAATDEIRCVSCDQALEGEWVRITVTDTGSGIPSDVLPHLFEPFFTTKEIGRGTGLGLAQVYGIVHQHEGHIDVTTKVREGTTFAIYLPALEVRSTEPSLPDISAVPQGRGEVVLVVEDGGAVRTALVECLEQLNYQTLEAANGEQALALMEEQGEQIALVLSDVVMPVMGGIALLHALREKGWHMPVILLTGHPMREELDGLLAQGLSAWLPKPPSVERLAQAVAAALRR